MTGLYWLLKAPHLIGWSIASRITKSVEPLVVLILELKDNAKVILFLIVYHEIPQNSIPSDSPCDSQPQTLLMLLPTMLKQ